MFSLGVTCPNFFNGGIFGSPDTKEHILMREIYYNNIIEPSIYLGDSKYDFIAAKASGMHFLFLSGWSEVGDWYSFCKKNK
jgi:phosphoglycolate phosphatase-like HAD superfamily hydrolase